jgi:hypothetical protein
MIEIILFVIGIISLIKGRLTVLNFRIQGYQARTVGIILISPLLLVVGIIAIAGFEEFLSIHWINTPTLALFGILGTFIYLYYAQPDRKSTLMFWLIATIPAIGLLITRNFPSPYGTIFGYSIPLPIRITLQLRDVITGFIMPVALSFVVNLTVPVARNKLNAVLFSLPVYFVHAYENLGSILRGMVSVVFPTDVIGVGFYEIMNGFISIQISSLLVLLVAYAVWIAAKIRRKI